MGEALWVGIFILWTPILWAAEGINVVIPPGKYAPFFKESGDRKASPKKNKTVEPSRLEIEVPSFLMDRFPVSNRDFSRFLAENPQYRKSQVLPLYAEAQYLQHWKADVLSVEELKTIGEKPVTNVSWFIARRYCRSLGKRLPTITEWEYASDAGDPEVLPQLLVWYAKTGDGEIDDVGRGKPNRLGLYDMHGLIWEWVEDFNSVMISSDSRARGDRSAGYFCGAGSIDARNSQDYATFMRFGFRSGLRGDYCIRNLGFRCASDLKKGN